MRPSDHKTSCRIDKISGLFIQQFIVHYRFDHVLDQIFPDLGQFYVRIVLCGNDDRIDTGNLIVIVFYSDLCLSVRAKIFQCPVFSHLSQSSGQFMCQRDRHRHVFRRFIAGKTKHKSLVSCTGLFQRIAFIVQCALLIFQRFINTHGDIGRLLVYSCQDRTDIAVIAVFCPVVSNVTDHFSRQFLDIDIASRADFSHDHSISCIHCCFCCHTTLRILRHDRINDSI